MLLIKLYESLYHLLSGKLYANIDEDLSGDDKWFEKYNPIKIFINKQEVDDFEIQRID